MAICVEKLCKEVRLDFQRSMNKIIFDKFVKSSPSRYPFICVEEKVVEYIPFQG